MDQYWSYILMTVGVLGLYLLSNKYRAGWYIGVFAQVLWVVYAIVTEQYGFIVSAAVYAAVNMNGLLKSRPKPISSVDPMELAKKEAYVEGLREAMVVVKNNQERQQIGAWLSTLLKTQERVLFNMREEANK